MKKVLLLTVLLVFVASAAMAQVPAKPFTIYVGGGLTMPMSPDGFKDNQSMGFHGFGQLGFNVIPKGELVINLEYHMFGGDWQDPDITGGGDFSVIMAGADFKLNLGLPAAPMRPFILGGAGIAIESVSDFETTLGDISFDSENDIYIQFGGGVTFNKFFVKARYVHIMTEGDATAMVPVSVGISF